MGCCIQHHAEPQVQWLCHLNIWKVRGTILREENLLTITASAIVDYRGVDVSGTSCSAPGWGLYSPPGIPPGIRLQSQNSTRLITEFDIPVESAWNIMGIVFVLLCLVIPYRVRPHSVKKKLKSMDHLVDFHGTSTRSSREIIHVMLSHARTKQTMFVWRLAHQTRPTLFFPPPSSHHHQPCLSPVTAANHALHRHWPSWLPTNANDHQRPHCHHDRPKNEADHPQTKTATHIRTMARERRPAATYGHGQQRAEVSKLTSPLLIISLPQVPCHQQRRGNQTTCHNEDMATTSSRDNDEEGRGQRHGEDTWQRRGHMTTRICDDSTWKRHRMPMRDDDGWSIRRHERPTTLSLEQRQDHHDSDGGHAAWKLMRAHHHHHSQTKQRGHTTTTHEQCNQRPATPPTKNNKGPATPPAVDDEGPVPPTNDNEGPAPPAMRAFLSPYSLPPL